MTRKTLFIIFLILAASAAAVFSQRGNSLSLEELAAELNMALPREIDRVTVLEKVTLDEARVLTYAYAVKAPKSAIDAHALRQKTRADALAFWCEKDRQGLLSQANAIAYRYHDNWGEDIGEVRISEADCKDYYSHLNNEW